MSPAPAIIFTPKILYLYVTLKSLKNPNPLTTIPAHQLQHHHNLSLSIVTCLTSSTLKNMSNETFKTDHGNVPKLTEENYPVWKQKIRQVLIAMKAYNIVTSVELLPLGNGVALRSLQERWHGRANTALAQIHLGCCDELLPLIVNIDDPVEMWEALRHQLENGSTKLGHTQVLRKFTASRPSPDETVTQYLTKLIAFHTKLISTTENLTDDPWRHISSLPYPIHMKRPSKSLNSGSPLPRPSTVWMRSANMPSEGP